ncbi:hypothetical protein N7E81_02515 [Reichenbachiella carrageenanivorans]|uniref:N-acetyltransferase domain-containing protein n=1 Tax=Reichenbachiella carrageenanivorans TaxID=2979869 RepID=A0ABY6D4J9_9BACT|nr:hypothetical protein [Reichenbachiella carrageenanivorans]UXX79978.1 hypothetical protein N7E81_02515 [Reichenbachiella carrageenanivorans]
MIEVKKVQDKKNLKRFIDFPHALYEHDENYVPELYLAQKDLLDKKNHPFFKHSEADFFLAYKGQEIVGRIAAIKNNNYIAYTGESTGKFGFIDFIEEYEVAEALLNTAVDWVKEKGLSQLAGPENFSTNETCGTLIEGFDMPPTIMMPYNKPYYQDYLEKYGFEKDMDLLSYKIYQKDVPDKLVRLSSKILERLNNKGITVRKINVKKFTEEIDKIIEIYNSAWEKNWGFVPMTDEEFKHAAKDMKQIVDPDFVLIAEHNGKPVGFTLSIPDMNMPLKYLKRGRLLPFGLFKLLYHKKEINRVRIITLGIVEKYRKMGIDAYFYAKAFEECKRKGLLFGEASWILENNEMMNKAIENINGKVYKKHRLYKKAI